MLSLLFLAVIVLAVILTDTRSRLKRLEDRFEREGREGDALQYQDLLPEDVYQPASEPRPAQTARVVHGASAFRTSVETQVESTAGQAAQAESVEQAEEEARPDWETQEEAALVPPWRTADEMPEPAEEAPEPEMSMSRPQAGASFSFEDIFGRKLPIWAGGITLAIAAILLVKYSIDAGLLSPAVRVILGLLFGAGLIGGAEWARREEERVGDVRIRQALAGAGIASLYASILAAVNLYGLIPGGVAFSGLAVATALALGLSLRFGMPSAILGLVGGLAAPALIGSTAPNLPLLCGYLGLAIGGLTAVARHQRWAWLGASALLGGAGWSLLLMVTGALSHADMLAIGLLVIALALALPLVAFQDKGATLLRGASGLIGAVQMALLVSIGGFEMLQWGLYGLLSAGIVWLSTREAALRPFTLLGLAVALMLAIAWPHPGGREFALVMLAMAGIYGAPAMTRLWRANGTIVEALQIGALALGGYIASLTHFHGAGLNDMRSAVLAFACALLPGAAAALGWKQEDNRSDARFTIVSAAASLLLLFAGHFGLPEQWKAIAATLAIAMVTEISRKTRSSALFTSMAIFAGGAALAALWPIVEWSWAAIFSLSGKPVFVTALPSPMTTLHQLAIPALLSSVAAFRIWPMLRTEVRLGVAAIPATLGIASIHIFYKQLFALTSHYDFVHYGLGERLIWESLIMGAGYALWKRFGQAGAALALIAAAAAHGLWYNILLHNPMTVDQAVGSAPLANLLLGVYGLPMLAMWLAGQIAPEQEKRLSRAFDIGRMLFVVMGAYALLRQLFTGSMLTYGSVGEFENILRSVLAIALAVGFLLWGIWRKKHDWRIASLLLMLGAVAKVFLFDISGLAGLLRIASFLALGFSLIGIGWLYSRFLRKEDVS